MKKYLKYFKAQLKKYNKLSDNLKIKTLAAIILR